MNKRAEDHASEFRALFRSSKLVKLSPVVYGSKAVLPLYFFLVGMLVIVILHF